MMIVGQSQGLKNNVKKEEEKIKQRQFLANEKKLVKASDQ